MQEINFEEVPSITFANGRGDVTITWTEENKAFVKELIEKKINAGYTFFIYTPRKLFGTLRPSVKTKLTKKNMAGYIDKVSEAVMIEEEDDFRLDINMPASNSKKSLSVKQEGFEISYDVGDEDIEARLMENKIQLLKKGKYRNVTRSKDMYRSRDSDEILENKSIAVRPIVGG